MILAVKDTFAPQFAQIWICPLDNVEVRFETRGSIQSAWRL